jgi:ubiquinone/menaquinone biosynthesis C-methylase UbiE/glycosyltransferase involved in cell wall biosynthesis
MLAQALTDDQRVTALDGDRPIEGHDIVCVSVMDWDWPFWTSRHHLMNELARRNRVLFVDPPLTFATDYLNARRDPRLARKLTGWTRHGGLRRAQPNLLTWSPPPGIPFNRVSSRAPFEALLRINQQVFQAGLRRTLARLGIQRPILWVSFNVYAGDAVVGQLGEALSVYHCTDEVTGFPGYSHYIAEIEARLASKSDLVIATSEVLRDDKARYNPNSHFVPNAADVELFNQALAWTAPEPADLRSIPRPRAGFIGNIEYRFDAGLVRYAAEHLPEWSFVLIGPLQDGYPELEALRHLPNVRFLGLKARARLPAYLAGLDVTMIPYRLNRLTDSIYPLKVHEYLAAGKPVVATPIPSMRRMVDRVSLASDGPSFAEALVQAAREDTPQRRDWRQRLAGRETWAARTAEISGLIRRTLDEQDEAERTPEDPLSPVVRRQLASQSGRLSFSRFMTLGRELALRHRNPLKRWAYRLAGDLNLHRRVRSAHVTLALKRGLPSGAAVLDAGCGEGACSFALTSLLGDVRVTGVDVDPDAIAACRSVASGLPDRDLRFEEADLASLRYDQQFDAAVCSEVLEHISEDEAALRGLHRALKPGGRLVVHVPLQHRLQRRVLPGYRGGCVADHVREEYVEAEIVEKVQRAGFRVDRVLSTFGPAGELAYELNTLPFGERLGRLLALATLPVAMVLAYLDLAVRARPRGNSLLVIASKPAATLLPTAAGGV